MNISYLTGTVHDDSYRWVPEEPVAVDLLKGANMSFRRKKLETVGGFDRRFGGPAQREETDVCVRIRKHGEIIYDPALQCFHKQTGESEFGQDHIEWRFRNHRHFVEKNFGLLTAAIGFLSLFTRLCGNPDSMAQLLFRRLVMRQPISIRRCLWAYGKGIE